MKAIFKPGDTKVYTTTVKPEDQASFHGEVLHAAHRLDAVIGVGGDPLGADEVVFGAEA